MGAVEPGEAILQLRGKTENNCIKIMKMSADIVEKRKRKIIY